MKGWATRPPANRKPILERQSPPEHGWALVFLLNEPTLDCGCPTHPRLSANVRDPLHLTFLGLATKAPVARHTLWYQPSQTKIQLVTQASYTYFHRLGPSQPRSQEEHMYFSTTQTP
jgi:hypothetical protein